MRKYLLGIAVFLLAFGVLSISVLESASVKYAFTSPTPEPSGGLGSKPSPKIEYQLPYPGTILPDSPFWSVKALRDKIWYALTTNVSKKSDLSLLFADKRLVMAKSLFEKDKPDLAFSTLTKAEKYLETALGLEKEARSRGMDTTSLLTKLATASLKHRQLIGEILLMAPEGAKPGIIKIEDYARTAYKQTSETLNSKGIPSPISPFEGD
jgi:hypothetical protein